MTGPHATGLTLDISGMHCAGCAGAVERALEQLAGPGKAQVNLSLERAEIQGDISADAAVKAVEAAGYGATPRAGTAAERRMAREQREAERRAEARWTLLMAALATMILLPFLVEMVAMLAGFSHGSVLSPLVQLALASVAQFVCGWRFVVGGARAFLRLSPNMDSLVALGTLAAFGVSAWRVLAGHAGHGEALYFEGGVAVIAFVLIGKTIEGRARGEARDALDALEREQPAIALVHRDGAWVEAAAATLKVGEFFAIRAGERAAADGVVRQGASAMDERLVTGESLPRPIGPGGRVIAGALNGDGALTVEATAVGEDSTIARLSRLVEQAQGTKSPSQRLADAVSRVFVPAVIGLAALTVAFWTLLGQTETALVAGVSVLVVACPCALGLATPLALVAGSGAAAKRGIAPASMAALEGAAEISTVAFDKTGTLTEGEPRLAAISAPGVGPDEALKLALALSIQGAHPLAAAVRAAAADREIVAEPATDLETLAGLGVRGRINGVTALFGAAELLRDNGITLGVLEQAISRDPGFGEAQTVSWLAGAGKVIGAFAFVDGLRGNAEQVVEALGAQGLRLVLLSGDRRSAAEAAGRKLGIADARGGLKPADKLRILAELKAEDAMVAMVGDGLNDAPALAAADLGVAMGTGAATAKAAAAVTLMRPDLRLLPELFAIARATRRVIRQNLWLAFGFNGIGLPLAALGLLTPAIAGAAMAGSSLAVALNAARLARMKV